MDKLLPALSQFVPKLTKTIMLPGCGHWTQQERPAETTRFLLDWLKGL
jgi:pimeloyl-ACP methyl ester carboxylesterase